MKWAVVAVICALITAASALASISRGYVNTSTFNEFKGGLNAYLVDKFSSMDERLKRIEGKQDAILEEVRKEKRK